MEDSPQIDGLEIIEEIGHGGMSTVYRAKEKVLDRFVAVKVLKSEYASDQDYLKRFRNEAKSASALSHPNIVKILSFGFSDKGLPYISMELLEGETLESLLRREAPLHKDRFSEIFMQVLDAVEFAHSKNLLHRDLKPANIMIQSMETDPSNNNLNEKEKSKARRAAQSGDSEDLIRRIQIKVLDFGIAKQLDPNSQSNQNTVGLSGTPNYMSPEQCSGASLDFRSDIYSLSCIMYEALSGFPPFQGETAIETMYSHLQESIPKLETISGSQEISASLVACIIQGLAKEPSKRQASLKEFGTQVRTALESGSFVQRKKKQFHPVTCVVLLAAIILLTVGLYVARDFFHTKDDPSSVKIGAQSRKAHTPHNMNSPRPAVLAKIRELQSQGEIQKALELAKQSLQGAEAIRKENPEILFDAYTLTGELLVLAHTPKEAARYYKLAADMYQPAKAQKRLDALRNQALAEASAKERKEALSTAKMLEKESKDFFGADRKADLAVAPFVRSDVLCRLVDLKEAKSEALKSLALFDQSPGKRTSNWGVNTCWLYYEICREMGNPQEGLIELNKAKKQVTDKDMHNIGIIEAYADEAVSHGELEEAKEFFELALARIKDNTQPAETVRIRIRKRISDIENGKTKLMLRLDPSRAKGKE